MARPIKTQPAAKKRPGAIQREVEETEDNGKDKEDERSQDEEDSEGISHRQSLAEALHACYARLATRASGDSGLVNKPCIGGSAEPSC
jgi:hypothetical protein